MKAKAIWWVSPSLLEPIDGPWGTVQSFGNDPVLAWHGIIDWAARLNVDRIITGVEPYMTDRVVGQWPFHYVCHFPHDPTARCFDSATVERNIKTSRQIAAYGLTKNVKILLHHYNFMAPETWVDTHKDLAQKLDAVDDPMWGKRFHPDRMGFLVAHICWSDPQYRDFLRRCWDELFANIPELSGLMVTPGEFSYCRCPACASAQSQSIFDAHDGTSSVAGSPRLRLSIDLIESVRRACDSAQKQLIVRTWGMEPWARQLPPGIEYATKFSVFDACWSGPDPIALEYSRAGHRAWMMHAIEAENSGPLLWHDEAWARDSATRLNECDTPGTIIHTNLHWGHRGQCSSFTSSRNIQRLLENLEPRANAAAGNEHSLAEFRQFFGDKQGDSVCEAAKLIAAVPLNMTAILHLQREGFTFHLQPWFDGKWRWPGVLGNSRMDPPQWANPDGLITLGALLRTIEENPTSLEKVVAGAPGDVIGRLDSLAAGAARAAAMLEGLQPPSSPSARSELQQLITSAQIAHLFAMESAASLRARIAWQTVKTCSDDRLAEKARTTAVQFYQSAVELLRAQLGLGLSLCTFFPDYLPHVVESHETFYRLPLATRLKIRREELRRIRCLARPIQSEDMTIDLNQLR